MGRDLTVGDDDLTPIRRPLLTICINLRSRHAEYLEELSAKEAFTQSEVLAALLQRHTSSTDAKRLSVYKTRKHLGITGENLAILDRLAVQLGFSRSEVVRRLIDEAINTTRQAR